MTATLYGLVGLAGYMTFKSRTAGDLLRNFGSAHVVRPPCACPPIRTLPPQFAGMS